MYNHIEPTGRSASTSNRAGNPISLRAFCSTKARGVSGDCGITANPLGPVLDAILKRVPYCQPASTNAVLNSSAKSVVSLELSPRQISNVPCEPLTASISAALWLAVRCRSASRFSLSVSSRLLVARVAITQKPPAIVKPAAIHRSHHVKAVTVSREFHHKYYAFDTGILHGSRIITS